MDNSGKAMPQNINNPQKICECGKPIAAGNKFCVYCGKKVEEPKPSVVQVTPVREQVHITNLNMCKTVCSGCGQVMDSNVKQCPKCGKILYQSYGAPIKSDANEVKEEKAGETAVLAPKAQAEPEKVEAVVEEPKEIPVEPTEQVKVEEVIKEEVKEEVKEEETISAETEVKETSGITCPKCGKTLDSTNNFCIYCGTKLQKQEAIKEEVSAEPVELVQEPKEEPIVEAVAEEPKIEPAIEEIKEEKPEVEVQATPEILEPESSQPEKVEEVAEEPKEISAEPEKVEEVKAEEPKSTETEEKDSTSIACPKCGKMLNSTNNFCIYCGTKLQKQEVIKEEIPAVTVEAAKEPKAEPIVEVKPQEPKEEPVIESVPENSVEIAAEEPKNEPAIEEIKEEKPEEVVASAPEIQVAPEPEIKEPERVDAVVEPQVAPAEPVITNEEPAIIPQEPVVTVQEPVVVPQEPVYQETYQQQPVYQEQQAVQYVYDYCPACGRPYEGEYYCRACSTQLVFDQMPTTDQQYDTAEYSQPAYQEEQAVQYVYDYCPNCGRAYEGEYYCRACGTQLVY